MFVAVVMLRGPSVRAEVYLHPSWNGSAKSDSVLAVFPATFDMVTKGARGRPSLRREESDVVQAQLARYVIGALQATGWTVVDDVVRGRDIAENRELLYLVGYLRERHATLAQRIMISSKEMKAGRVSFGRPITELKPYTNANILVFVHVEGFNYTLAARILEIAKTVALHEAVELAFREDLFARRQIRIRVSFVNAETGDVLCFIRPSKTGEAGFLNELDKLPR